MRRERDDRDDYEAETGRSSPNPNARWDRGRWDVEDQKTSGYRDDDVDTSDEGYRDEDPSEEGEETRHRGSYPRNDASFARTWGRGWRDDRGTSREQPRGRSGSRGPARDHYQNQGDRGRSRREREEGIEGEYREDRDRFRGNEYGEPARRRYQSPGQGRSARYGRGSEPRGSQTGMGGGVEGISYAGRGPKGWKRSDDRIREDLNERLTSHPGIDATEVEVVVDEGKVTLSGSVNDETARREAEEVAESISGVTDVTVNLTISGSARRRQSRLGAGTRTGSRTSDRKRGPGTGGRNQSSSKRDRAETRSRNRASGRNRRPTPSR